jgi:Glycoside hydrolase family 2 C-terminal domain 5
MRRIPFTAGWRTRPHANFFAEMHGAAAPWQEVTLPHDALLGQPRDAAHSTGSGYFPGGVFEYRKTFAVPVEQRDRVLALEFEGVYRAAMVYVNAVFLGEDREVTVSVAGAGVLAGFGSAAPSTEESYLDAVHTSFDGRALAVVRPTGPGTITVRASAPGCDDVSVTVQAG